jgi:hypothetical protein
VGHVLDQFRVGTAARSPPEPVACGNGRSSVTFKLNQLSLACPVKRAQPPWTVDDTALIPSLTTSQLTTGRSVRTESATYAAPIVRTMPSMIPKNMRIQAPFCGERSPRLGAVPPRLGRTLAFLRFRSSAVVISARGDSVDKRRFAGIADRRKDGQDVRERKRHCRVHPSAGCGHSGKEAWNAFAKTGKPREVNA